MATSISVTDEEFERVVLEADGLVMVDFWAPWCPPCRVISPMLEELAGEYAGRVTIAKLNTDNGMERATQLGVQGMPTLIFFRQGQEVGRIIGAGSKASYQQKLEALL
jgi:thioredoxin 1